MLNDIRMNDPNKIHLSLFLQNGMGYLVEILYGVLVVSWC